MSLGSLVLSLLSAAEAGSITAPAVIGGVEGSPATGGPLGVHYNPAAIAGTKRVDLLLDGQVSFVRVDIDNERNEGIDPNTGEPYILSTARVTAPVPLLAGSVKVIPKRLTAGLGVSIPFLGGGDYTSTEPDDQVPYVGPQRYGTIETRVISLAVTPALSLTTIEGLHVGGAVAIHFDSMSVMRASDPLGTEGVPADQLDTVPPADPYSTDVILEGRGLSGNHVSFLAGAYFDRFELLQLGVGFRGPGKIDVSGEGSVQAPESFGGVNVPANVGIDFQLPAILYSGATVKVPGGIVEAGVAWEWQLWNACCGTPDGDVIISLTSEDGDPIGAEDGLGLEVSDTLYSPRRLWNSNNLAVFTGISPPGPLWFGLRVGYNQFAVPSYAVNAANLDFANVGALLSTRIRLADKVELGLGYHKFFLMDRDVTDSAWDLRDGNERFSPEFPFNAGSNGLYSGAVDGVSLRVGVSL